MTSSTVIYDFIATLSLFNFMRIFVMLLGSDMYDIKQIKRQHHNQRLSPYRPLVSIVIPAFNEETGVIRTLESVLASRYNNYEVIIIDDGSTDRTAQIVRSYIKALPKFELESYAASWNRWSNLKRRYFHAEVNKHRVVFVSQENGGKGSALNNGIRNYARGKLIMVVDADSLLHTTALGKMVQHFRDRRVIASASNVKIIPSRSGLGIAQRIEYLISYRMKRSLTYFGMEYIIGGVGSTFRRSALIKTDLYDTDTMTEDIDLTLKLIQHYGNTRYKIHYAADAITYTEHVLRVRSLIKQRFRWKYGRFQSLLKNKALFFAKKGGKYSTQLTWYQLPYALFGELVLFIEPILVTYILYITVRYLDLSSLFSVYCIVTTFVFLMILGEESEAWHSKVLMSFILPAVYFMMYVLTFVEFAALIKSIKQSKKLFDGKTYEGSWEHVERSGEPVTVTP